MALKTNPNIKIGTKDSLFHLAIDTETLNFKEFNDVKFVCLGGSPNRMFKFAKFMNEKLTKSAEEPKNYAEGTDRYCLYKAGPVLIANHGIGSASLSIVLNELFKLLFYAQCTGVIFIRLGTCGGIGIDPGTVVLTDRVLNGELKPIFSYMKLGHKHESTTTVDSDLVEDIWDKCNDHFKMARGATCSLDCFYEAQGRLDGALCDYSAKDKQDFIRRLQDEGVINMEMEGLALFSYCHRAGYKAAMIAVAIVNRVIGDIPTCENNEIKEWEERPFNVALHYIKAKLGIQ